MCLPMLALGSRSRMLLAGGVCTHSYLAASFVGSLLAAIGKWMGQGCSSPVCSMSLETQASTRNRFTLLVGKLRLGALPCVLSADFALGMNTGLCV